MNKENKELYLKLYYKKMVTKYPAFVGRENTIPPPKLSENSTKQLTELIIDFLELNGHQAWKQETTGRRIDKRTQYTDVFGNKRTIGSIIWAKSADKVGRADIGAKIMIEMYEQIIPVAVEIEIKWKKDYQKEKQIKYQEDLEAIGGLYFIIKTFDQFIDWFYKFLNKYTMKNTPLPQLSADVQLKVVATHKETLKQFEKIMTYSEWMSLKKDSKYNYNAYQL